MTIILNDDRLNFDFSAYHEDAKLGLHFQRTLRIPDDGRDHNLPPGLGSFPLRHVDDYAARLPADWVQRGGVFFPMYQAEAMWISFNSWTEYPFALKIATGKINCVNGENWDLKMRRESQARAQNYVVVPDQPWLDGYAVEKGVVRQFVAMPLGKGFSAEEQITGEAKWGGIQIVAIPLKKSKYEQIKKQRIRMFAQALSVPASCHAESSSMGLAPGGRMHQQIFEDKFDLSDWETSAAERCFVSILNSEQWQAVTGEKSPTKPVTAADYTRCGLPWFDYYADKPTVQGSEVLAKMKGIAAKAHEIDRSLVAEFSESIPVTRVIKLAPKIPGTVRQGQF